MILTKNKILTLIFSIFFSLLFVFSGVCPSNVRADSSETYSNVLDDLKKDSTFIEDDYPLISDDYSLEVISISESTEKDLFIYVYSPNSFIMATSINFSVNKNLEYDNYFLKLVSKEGVFHKYKVKDFKASSDMIRYYDISSIFRRFDSVLGDINTGIENTTSEVAYKVGKCYTLTDNQEGGYSLSLDIIDLITVTDRYVGFIRYPNGGWFNIVDGVDVHFIAFSTDNKIEELLEADLIYYSTYKRVSYAGMSSDAIYGNKEKNKVNIKYDKNLTYNGQGWWANDYSWPSIETASNFIITEENGKYYEGATDIHTEFVSDTRENILSQEWVIRFANTTYDYYENAHGDHSTVTTTVVTDVSILRLAFKTDGKYYNLGVVDNKTSGSEKPIGTAKAPSSCSDFNLKFIFSVLLIVLLISLLNKFGLLDLIIKIIRAPFVFIANLINKRKR